MKKVLISVLAAALIFGSASFAAQWQEGCSPENPYANAEGKAVDFTQTTGYMMVNPMNGSSVEYGLHGVSIYMPRTDLEKVGGTLYLNTASGSQVAAVELTDTNFIQRELTEEELADLNWGAGTVFTIEFGIPLDPDTKYVVQLTEGAISAPEYGNATPAIAGNQGWVFTVESQDESSIDSMYVMRNEVIEPEEMVEDDNEDTIDEEPAPVVLEVPEEALPIGATYQVGDNVHFVVRVGGDAVSASIYTMSGMIDCSDVYFTEDSEVMISFLEATEVQWGVLWQDADGNVIDSIQFDYPVVEQA